MLRYAVIVAACLLSSDVHAAPGEVIDPVGDVLGLNQQPLDVSRMSARVANGALMLEVSYTGPTPPSGLIEIDTDPIAVTGRPSVVSMLCPRQSGLDADVLVDLFSLNPGGGFVPLADAKLNALGTAPAQSEPGILTLRIPLTMLGGRSQVHVAAALGTSMELTDCVPNGGFLVSAAAAAPPATPIPATNRMFLALMTLLLTWFATRRLRTVVIKQG